MVKVKYKLHKEFSTFTSRPSNYYLLKSVTKKFYAMLTDFNMGYYVLNTPFTSRFSYTSEGIPIFSIFTELKNVQNTFSGHYKS
jgi:hypothetical protein